MGRSEVSMRKEFKHVNGAPRDGLLKADIMSANPMIERM
jgi:hypothetical protein